MLTSVLTHSPSQYIWSTSQPGSVVVALVVVVVVSVVELVLVLPEPLPVVGVPVVVSTVPAVVGVTVVDEGSSVLDDVMVAALSRNSGFSSRQPPTDVSRNAATIGASARHDPQDSALRSARTIALGRPHHGTPTPSRVLALGGAGRRAAARARFRAWV